MSKNTTRKTFPNKSTPIEAAPGGRFARLRSGKAAPVSFVLFVKTVTLFLTLGFYYLLVFFTAITVVPLTVGFVKAGSGITLDMPLETVLAVWIAPSLFLVALIFALLLFVIRAVWRFRTGVVEKASRWALGEEAPTNTASLNAAKNARIRENKTTAA